MRGRCLLPLLAEKESPLLKKNGILESGIAQGSHPHPTTPVNSNISNDISPASWLDRCQSRWASSLASEPLERVNRVRNQAPTHWCSANMARTPKSEGWPGDWSSLRGSPGPCARARHHYMAQGQRVREPGPKIERARHHSGGWATGDWRRIDGTHTSERPNCTPRLRPCDDPYRPAPNVAASQPDRPRRSD